MNIKITITEQEYDIITDLLNEFHDDESDTSSYYENEIEYILEKLSIRYDEAEKRRN